MTNIFNNSDPNLKVLKEIVEDLLCFNSNFAGMSKYLNRIIFNWSDEIETACAGHGFIFVNKEFFMKLPSADRDTLIAHEIWHLILRHLERGKGYNHLYYNMAADYVINLLLENDGFTFTELKPLLDQKYYKLSTEEIYKIIYKEEENRLSKKDEDNTENIKKSEDYISDDELKEMIKKAIKSSENISEDDEDSDKKVESILEKHINNNRNELNKSHIHSPYISGDDLLVLKNNLNNNVIIRNATYESIFKKYLTDPVNNNKRTFNKLNRRGYNDNHGIRLPGKLKRKDKENRLKHLTYALDVSGSISKEHANLFNKSVITIKKLLNPKKLTILFFDTKIVLEKTFTDKQEYEEIKVRAGGGTNLKDVYKRTKELNSEALIVFTDLQVGIPKQENWDSIWIIPDDIAVNVPRNIYGKIYSVPNNKDNNK